MMRYFYLGLGYLLAMAVTASAEFKIEDAAQVTVGCIINVAARFNSHPKAVRAQDRLRDFGLDDGETADSGGLHYLRECIAMDPQAGAPSFGLTLSKEIQRAKYWDSRMSIAEVIVLVRHNAVPL